MYTQSEEFPFEKAIKSYMYLYVTKYSLTSLCVIGFNMYNKTCSTGYCPLHMYGPYRAKLGKRDTSSRGSSNVILIWTALHSFCARLSNYLQWCMHEYAITGLNYNLQMYSNEMPISTVHDKSTKNCIQPDCEYNEYSRKCCVVTV